MTKETQAFVEQSIAASEGLRLEYFEIVDGWTLQQVENWEDTDFYSIGASYQIDWVDHIRTGRALPYEKGKITYYRTFEHRWQSDFDASKTEPLRLSLGQGARSLCYDPKNPPAFCREGIFQRNFSDRRDVITLMTEPQDRDLFIKGQIQAELTVSSTAPDTSFYINVSIRKPEGDYTLRHDITSLCYQLGTYEPNSVAALKFCFDEHAFLMKKGECLRIDISSTDRDTYVCHTNQSGAYYLQTEAKSAVNTVYLDESFLILPVEMN